jgi:hypothetical protein
MNSFRRLLFVPSIFKYSSVFTFVLDPSLALSYPDIKTKKKFRNKLNKHMLKVKFYSWLICELPILSILF